MTSYTAFRQGLSQSVGPVRLRSGVVLRDVHVAYVAQGVLNDAGTNAILVTHGYTANHFMLARGGVTAEGSWAGLVGPGRPLDPERYFIVCSNVLGSSYGTTGPASIDPATGQPYGRDFPEIEFADIVQVQHQLLTQLGVRRLHAVVGPSYGGFQALQWALDHPDWVSAIGVVLSGAYLPAHPQMDLLRLREALRSDPAWNEGDYSPADAMRETLTQLRIENLSAHGTLAVLRDQGVPASQRAAEVKSQAEKWAARFDAHALVTLLKAGLRFDVRARLSEIRCPALHVLSTTDTLFPSDGTCELSGIPDLRRVLLNSPYGHQASGVACADWRDALFTLLDHA